MNVQLKKGVLELCVLALLGQKDYYGYEIVQIISKNIDISEGTIYPLLHRLKKEGYFETYLIESLEGPSRKYYKITKKGIKQKENLTKEWNQLNKGVQDILNNLS